MNALLVWKKKERKQKIEVCTMWESKRGDLILLIYIILFKYSKTVDIKMF
jgi:hypothetical protein